MDYDVLGVLLAYFFKKVTKYFVISKKNSTFAAAFGDYVFK